MSDAGVFESKLIRGDERFEVWLVHLDHESLQQEVVRRCQMVVPVVLYRLDQAI